MKHNIQNRILYKVYLAIILLLIVLPVISYSQATHSIEWQRCFGGSRNEMGEAHGTYVRNPFIKTSDGGFIFVGATSSIDGDVDIKKRHDDFFPLDSFRNDDIWIVKLTASGEVQWDKIYGGDNTDLVYSIIPTSDGGYALCGLTSSVKGDFYFDTTGLYDTSSLIYKMWIRGGFIDAFILKIDSIGKKEWISRIGGTKIDILQSLVQTSDGGILAVGSTNSDDEIWLDLPWVRNTDSWDDAFIVKLDSVGNKKWNRIYGRNGRDGLYSIVEKSNGNYLLCGGADTLERQEYDSHAWLIEVDNTGNIIWQKYYGGSRNDGANMILNANDEGFVIVGATFSYELGYHPDPNRIGENPFDAWIFKIDDTGRIVWQSCLGGSQQDGISSIIPTKSGGYAFIGYTNSSDSDLTGIHKPENAWDVWVGELSADGKLLWQKCLGGTGNDYGNSIIETDDGFMVYGSVGSNDGDIVGNHGGSIQHNRDIWVAKLKTNQNAVEASSESHFANPYPNPSGDEVSLRIHPTIAPQSVKFYNLLGQEFTLNYTLDGNLLTANITSLPKGMYVIRISYPGITFQETRKFVKAN